MEIDFAIIQVDTCFIGNETNKKSTGNCNAIGCKEIDCSSVAAATVIVRSIQTAMCNGTFQCDINNYEFHIRFEFPVTQSNTYFAKLISFKFPHALLYYSCAVPIHLAHGSCSFIIFHFDWFLCAVSRSFFRGCCCYGMLMLMFDWYSLHAFVPICIAAVGILSANSYVFLFLFQWFCAIVMFGVHGNRIGWFVISIQLNRNSTPRKCGLYWLSSQPKAK